jgi:hypothetical protein
MPLLFGENVHVTYSPITDAEWRLVSRQAARGSMLVVAGRHECAADCV